MKFVNYHIFQIFKQLDPSGMMRQYSRMQHIWISDHDMSRLAYFLAGVLRRIAVEGEGLDIRFKCSYNSIEFAYLVLRERLGREKV